MLGITEPVHIITFVIFLGAVVIVRVQFDIFLVVVGFFSYHR